MKAHDPIRRRDNQKKYSGPPTWEQIERVVKKTGMSKFHFELFYGINHNHLAQVKRGQRQLSLTYWHIFYEFGKRRPKSPIKDVPPPVPRKPIHTDNFVHERLSILK